ncbi:MAG: GNAT family N-acetyltransferase [Bacteroidetes bacterium]|nr:GNAT family N-acetyltransferase [Bacteroidota bacterium]MBS1942305.1 GNAT family N-acetyltransferase [Bacteroidota bacterium]
MLGTDPAHTPVLTTKHLVLHALEERDAEAVHGLRSNPAVMRFIPKPLFTHVEESLRMIQDFRQAARQGTCVMWGITVHGSAQLVGYIGYWRLVNGMHLAEIGYALHPDLWGQGLMSEALEAVLAFGFGTMHLKTVEAQVTPDNVASIHVLERNGFRAVSRTMQQYGGETGALEAIIYRLGATTSH